MRTKLLLALCFAALWPPGLALAQTISGEEGIKPAETERTPNAVRNPKDPQLERSSPEATLDLIRRLQRARDSSSPTDKR